LSLVSVERTMMHVCRHAERAAFTQRSGVWNQEWAEGRERCWDDPLTDLGKEQAREAAQQLLLDDKPRRLVCSPFVRCVETALEMGKVLALPVEVDAALCENMREEWFGGNAFPFNQVMLGVDELRACGFDVRAVGAPQLFPAAVVPTTWENEDHNRLVRPQRLAQAVRDWPDLFAGCVLVTHGGVGHQLVRALVSGDDDTADVGPVEYAARSTINLARLQEPCKADGSMPALHRAFQSPLRFTPSQDWMTAHLPTWAYLLAPGRLRKTGFPLPSAGGLKEDKLQLLELGSWEGLSAKNWLQHFPGFPRAHLTLVDHFDVANPSPQARADGQARYDKLCWNLRLTGHFNAVTIMPLFTLPALSQLLAAWRVFHFIYVDADHSTVGVLNDLTLAWPMLAQNGLMLIDDYEWPTARNEEEARRGQPPSQDHPAHPKRGIDAFLAAHSDELEVVHKAYQVLVRKTAPQAFRFPKEEDVHALLQSDNKDAQVAGSSSKAVTRVQGGASLALASASSSTKTVAVLLPLTSRGSTRASLLGSLREFEGCLPPPDSVVLMVGTDDDDPIIDDELLRDAFSHLWKAGRVLHRVFPSARPAPTPLCQIVAALGKQAYELQDELRCDFFVLLGDDVRIEPKRSWLSEVIAAFERIHVRVSERFQQSAGAASSPVAVPLGFGVVALRDCTFPGFPTFPVLSRVHLDLFDGALWPALFVNQDADPFVWALYRPFGAREFASNVELRNLTGGDELNQPRYERQHVDWKNDVLRDSIKHLEEGLAAGPFGETCPDALAHIRMRSLVCLDVITPTFRCDRALLRGVLSLPSPADADVAWILIVDDPAGALLRQELERDFAHWRSVTIRVNKANLGASASRNAGLDEASGEWVLFLDDDVVPHPWLLERYVQAIRAKGARASGFAGLSCLPEPCTYLTAGLAMSYLTYFWCVAELLAGGEQAPWAVTANVLARRGRTRFNLDFLKTGGGEDILFLRETVAEQGGKPLLKAPLASIEHPWWDAAQPHPIRFFRWAASDSRLMDADKQPQHAFYSAPHAVEYSVLLLVLGVAWSLLLSSSVLAGLARVLVQLSCLWLCEALLGVWHHCSDASVAPSVRGWRRLLCSLIASTYVAWCEVGHTWAPLRRGHFWLFCKRVDWWYGLNASYQPERCAREAWHAAVFTAAIAGGAVVGWPFAALPVFTMAAVISLLWYVFTAGDTANPLASSGKTTAAAKSVALSMAADQVAHEPMHVTFICDSTFAPGLAVAVRSLLDHHTGADAVLPLHVHVVDAGLTEEDWSKIAFMQPPSGSSSVTFSRIRASANSFDTKLLRHYPIELRRHWPLYAKLFLDELLPQQVSMCIYLDCDVLMRGSLLPVWEQLQASARSPSAAPVLAVRDAGLPSGEASLALFGWRPFSGKQTDRYFNAGVLGLNLSMWRGEQEHNGLQLGSCLRDLARHLCAQPSLRHREQDVLNLIMRNRWEELPHAFNVQGIGTYGEDRSRPGVTSSQQHAYRPQLYSPSDWRSLSANPTLVHFTGPSVPTPSSALCPYVAAPSKPWAWFCHNSFKSEWHSTLQRTPFKNHFKHNDTLKHLRQGFEQDLRALGQIESHPKLHQALLQAASASRPDTLLFSSGAAGLPSHGGKRCLVAGGGEPNRLCSAADVPVVMKLMCVLISLFLAHSAGFIGTHLAKKLKEQGHYVRMTQTSASSNPTGAMELISACLHFCMCRWLWRTASGMRSWTRPPSATSFTWSTCACWSPVCRCVRVRSGCSTLRPIWAAWASSRRIRRCCCSTTSASARTCSRPRDDKVHNDTSSPPPRASIQRSCRRQLTSEGEARAAETAV
jgi:lipopolysaccharide biosynthesis glycosyltransferase